MKSHFKIPRKKKPSRLSLRKSVTLAFKALPYEPGDAKHSVVVRRITIIVKRSGNRRVFPKRFAKMLREFILSTIVPDTELI